MATFSSHNSIRLIHGGKEFFDVLEKLIDSAKHSIHLHTYIFEPDETGTRIAKALLRAAERKVKIYVLIDGYASKNFPAHFIEDFKKAKIHFRFFEPLFKSKSLYFGRRLHHKVFVSDGIHSLVGGINIADHYNDVGSHKAWLDFALYACGEVSEQLHKISCKVWRKKYLTYSNPKVDHLQKPCLPDSMENCEVRIRRNDWVRRRNEIERTYLEIFRTARQNITIVCSYFLPGMTFRRALKKATNRGVTIQVMLAGKSDVKVAKYAERYLYRWLLRNKVKVFEYQPRILHAKMAMADDKLFTVGSFNVNNISTLASIELNLDVRNTEFCHKVKNELNSIIEKDCKQIDAASSTIKFFSINQFFQWSAFQLIRFILTMTTFYFRQKE